MNLKIPLSVILGIGILLLASIPLRGCQEETPLSPEPKQPEIQYILDTVALSTFKARVEKLEGDSLRQAFALRAAARRAQLKLYSPDGTFVRDSGDSSKPEPVACVEERDLRTMMISDSTCPVERDSARTALAEESQVVEVLRDSIGAIENRQSRERIIFYAKVAAVVAGFEAIRRLVFQ